MNENSETMTYFMRRHKTHKGKLKNYIFYIVGCVFLLMIITGVFLLESIEYEENILIPCSDVNAEYNIINDDETYLFMNDIFGAAYISDSTELFKIHYLTKKPTDDLIKFLSNLPDSIANNYEKKFLLAQLSDECFAWDKSRLINFLVLTPEQHSRISDTSDHYDAFIRIFGAGGSNYFSKPIFNKERTLVIFERSQYIHWEAAYGDVFLYKRIDDKWALYFKKHLWIS